MTSKPTMLARMRLSAKRARGTVKGVDGKRTIKVTVRLNDGEWHAVQKAKPILSPHVELKDSQLVRELLLLGVRTLVNNKRK